MLCVTLAACSAPNQSSRWVSIVDDAELEKLTVKELRDLKDQIDLAIRAVIRASRAPKLAEPANAPEPAKFDLERERDAWLLAKK